MLVSPKCEAMLGADLVRLNLKHISLLSGLWAVGWIVFFLSVSFAWAKTEGLTQNDRLQIIEQAAGYIERDYLDPEKGAEIAKTLRSLKRSKALQQDLTTSFASELNKVLFQIGGDRHLTLKWVPHSGSTDSQLAAQSNWGVRSVEILDGNIGLVTIDGFYDGLEAKEALTAALLLVRSTEALIFDLTENRGGASDTVRFLQSCFFGAPKLVMLYEDEPGVRTESFTDQWPGRSTCADKPLYVLIGPNTASAAEDFIFSVRHFQMGTLVGQTSAGASNFVRHVRLEPGFRLSISVGQPIHPVTGTNWEGEGIVPDIEITSSKALAWAYVDALETLKEQNGSSRYDHGLLMAHFELEPVHLNLSDLTPFVGRYERVRLDLLKDGLFLKGSGFASSLRPIGPNAFALETARYDKNRPVVEITLSDGKATSLSLVYPNGHRDTFEKTGG
jgi:retinol-binding protein 3